MIVSVGFAALVFALNAADNPARVLGYVLTPFILAAGGVTVYRAASQKARQNQYVDQFAKACFWLTILTLLSRIGQAS
jgi:hypothetical protein